MRIENGKIVNIGMCEKERADDGKGNATKYLINQQMGKIYRHLLLVANKKFPKKTTATSIFAIENEERAERKSRPNRIHFEL